MARLPVVILPGYYGTILVDSEANDRTVWLTLGEIFNSGDLLDAINLEMGDPKRIVAAGILEEVPILGNWAPNVYKGIRLFLGSIGYLPDEVTSFGIDWRHSLRFNVGKLHEMIQRIGKVNIVAHSHGGLVAREYLRQHAEDGLVDRLIMLGTPHRGMLKTFKALVHGDDILKFSKSHVKKTARSFPSAYELLPSHAVDGFFKWNEADADPFTVKGWAETALHQKLNDAHGVISALPGNLPVKTAIIFGTHLPTNVLAEGGTNRKLKFTTRPQGDGTVPTISAAGRLLTGDIERYAIPYGQHTQLFEYESAQKVMRNFLFDEPKSHFAYRFQGQGTYRRRQKLGLAVDFRGPHGEFLPDAEVHLLMGSQRIPIPRHAEGDYFKSISMPNSSQLLRYEVVATSASLNETFRETGELHPLNV